MYKFHLFVVLFFGMLLLQGCPTKPSVLPETGNIQVTYTNATEIWLRVRVDSTSTTGVKVYREDTPLATFHTSPLDTVVIDTGLTPNSQYKYYTVRLQDGDEVSPSSPVVSKTLPVTSHHINWSVDTLGTFGSYLNDVAIVNENNIWVVGQIVTDEYDSSTGTNYSEYNAARWEGNHWELLKILSGHTANTGIRYFSNNDIWVTSGLPIHWNGQQWTLYHLWNMGILNPDDGEVTSVWGSATDGVYFVGRSGTIVRYDGATFTRLESGTTDWIIDMGGTSASDLWVATYDDYPHHNAIRHWNGAQWQERWHYQSGAWPPRDQTQPAGILSSVYVASHAVFIGCNALYTWIPSVHTGRLTLPSQVGWEPTWGTDLVRGTGVNDLFLVAGIGTHTVHWNGATWQSLVTLRQLDPGDTFHPTSIAVTPQQVVLAGYNDATGQAIVFRGSR